MLERKTITWIGVVAALLAISVAIAVISAPVEHLSPVLLVRIKSANPGKVDELQITFVNQDTFSIWAQSSDGVAREFSVWDSRGGYLQGISVDDNMFERIRAGESMTITLSGLYVPNRIQIQFKLRNWIGRQRNQVEAIDLSKLEESSSKPADEELANENED